MHANRSALPLPRYVLRKPLKAGWAYFFNVPMWARKAGCPVNERGAGRRLRRRRATRRNDFAASLRCMALRRHRCPAATVAKVGTLDWVFAEYRADRRFTQLDTKTKRNHEVGFRLVGGYMLKDGRRLGACR